MGRVGAGIAKGKFGKWLTEREAVYESVSIGVLTAYSERFGAPDFGTYFLDITEDNEGEAVSASQTEASIGARREWIDVLSISATETNEGVRTLIKAKAKQSSDVVSLLL